jgi:hypothetical protein
MRTRRFSLAVAAWCAVALAPAAWSQSGPGQRWIVTGSAMRDFVVAVDSTVAHSGRASLRIEALDDPSGFTSVATILAGPRYAGRRLRVSAMLRASGLGGQGAALWARADSAGKSVAFSSTQGTRQLAGDFGWTSASVELEVPREAGTVFLGALSAGSGRLWIDDVRVEVLPSRPGAEVAQLVGFEAPDRLDAPPVTPVASGSPSPRETPRPLSQRGLGNVEAFARLVGYVRFWYPGDSAVTTNWDEFTVRGMRLVEQAPTADSLAATLRALFAAIAPGVQLHLTGTTPAPSAPAPAPGGPAHLVFWEHCGFGVPKTDPAAAARTSTYHSIRRWIPASEGRFPAAVPVSGCGSATTIPLPDPAEPFAAALGGGVSASVPLAIRTTGDDRTPTWKAPAPSERFSIADRATRLADVALLWMVPQHFYPYFDVLPADWDAALRRALQRAATDDGGVPFDTTLQQLVAALRDGHGGVYRPGGVRGTPDLALGWVEGRIVVTAVGDSATARGIRRGDELLAIDGEPARAALARAEGLVSGATPQWVRQVALARLLTGDAGSRVALRVANPVDAGAPAREPSLVRLNAVPPTPPRPEKVAELRPGILYVDFDRVTDADVAAAMPRLEAARGIVFDMRGYPNRVNTPSVLAYLADSTIRSPFFEIPVVLRPDHAGMRFGDASWSVPPRRPRLRARVAFLSGGGSISYAESTLGVVEDNHLGDIVGEPTAGTNGNINPFSLPGGYTVRWTGLRVRKRDGTRHHGVGIIPNVPVAPTLRGVREGRDDVLERALDLVSARTP